MSRTFDCDKGFISKLLQTKDLTEVNDAQIDISYLSGDSKLAYKFIIETVRKTGEVPSVRAFSRKFPQYELEEVYDPDREEDVVGTEENMQFWCQELREKKKHNALADAAEDIVQSLEDYKADDALERMKKAVAYIENEVEPTEDADLTDTTGRKERYLKRKESMGMLGIPTGIDYLDYILRGLQDETLTTVIANTGIGKRLDLETPILTPYGFVPLKRIHKGSMVCGEDGKFYKVVLETPVVNTRVYRVSFEDGTYVDCCKDHLWKFKTIDDITRNNDWRVKTTEELLTNYPIKRGRGFNLCIPVNKPVEFREKNLPLDPYALGCLLGDGCFTCDSITFSNTEEDVVSKLNSCIGFYGKFVHRKGNPINYIYRPNTSKRTAFNLFRVLDDLELNWKYSYEKFIPIMYLSGSIEQRTRLLQGLIDTDGSVNSKGHTQFFTSSKQLMEDFVYLVRSLGYRCYSHSYDRGNSRVEYSVTIATDARIGTSEKHTAKYENAKVGKRVNHYDILKIVKIMKLPVFKRMKCLMVDSPDHTFICGDFIVTHNTWLEVLVGSFAMINGYHVSQFVTEMPVEQMRDRYEAMVYSMLHGNFNYSHFIRGMLSTKQEKKYFKFLDKELPNLTPLQVINATSVMGVSASYEKYKDTDLILIDGVYLMDDDQKADSDWLRVAHITRDLKKLAKRIHKPIFINSQADKNTSKKTGPELGNISYSQAIGMDSDNVLAMFRDQTMIADQEMCIKVIKQREGECGRVMMTWDFDHMKFDGIYSEKEGGDSYEESDDENEEAIGKNTIGEVE